MSRSGWDFRGLGKLLPLPRNSLLLPDAALTQIRDAPPLKSPSRDEGQTSIERPLLCGKEALQAASILMSFNASCQDPLQTSSWGKVGRGVGKGRERCPVHLRRLGGKEKGSENTLQIS